MHLKGFTHTLGLIKPHLQKNMYEGIHLQKVKVAIYFDSLTHLLRFGAVIFFRICKVLIHADQQYKLLHRMNIIHYLLDHLRYFKHLHAKPLQLLQATVHLSPFFLQLHRRLLQSVVQPHLITLRRSSGAGSKSVWMGVNPDSLIFQPHATGSISLLQPIH